MVLEIVKAPSVAQVVAVPKLLAQVLVVVGVVLEVPQVVFPLLFLAPALRVARQAKVLSGWKPKVLSGWGPNVRSGVLPAVNLGMGERHERSPLGSHERGRGRTSIAFL